MPAYMPRRFDALRVDKQLTGPNQYPLRSSYGCDCLSYLWRCDQLVEPFVGSVRVINLAQHIGIAIRMFCYRQAKIVNSIPYYRHSIQCSNENIVRHNLLAKYTIPVPLVVYSTLLQDNIIPQIVLHACVYQDARYSLSAGEFHPSFIIGCTSCSNRSLTFIGHSYLLGNYCQYMHKSPRIQTLIQGEGTMMFCRFLSDSHYGQVQPFFIFASCCILVLSEVPFFLYSSDKLSGINISHFGGFKCNLKLGPDTPQSRYDTNCDIIDFMGP